MLTDYYSSLRLQTTIVCQEFSVSGHRILFVLVRKLARNNLKLTEIKCSVLTMFRLQLFFVVSTNVVQILNIVINRCENQKSVNRTWREGHMHVLTLHHHNHHRFQTPLEKILTSQHMIQYTI